MSIRTIKPNYRSLILFLIIIFTFFHWFAFLTGESDKINIGRRSFIIIIFVFLLFFLRIKNIKFQKKNGFLFCLFLYFPIIDLIYQEIDRSIITFLWVIYGFLIMPWVLNIKFFHKKLRFFALGSVFVLILICILGFYLNYEEFYFGTNFRSRFTAGLANPGIISKLAVAVFFLCFLIWLLEKRFLFLFFAAVGLTVTALAGMRADMYSLILSIYVIVISSRPKIFIWGQILLSILAISIIITLFYIEFVLLDAFLSSRITAMWIPAFSETNFLESFISIIIGIGYQGTYFDSNFLYHLISYGIIGLCILLLFHIIIYLQFRLMLSSTNLQVRKIARWGLSVLIFIFSSGFVQPIFPTFFNGFGLLLVPVLIGLYSINFEYLQKNQKSY